MPRGVDAEKFVVMLDGTLLLVGALSPLGKRVTGFLDGFEKIIEMIGGICRFEYLGPNAPPSALCVVNASGNVYVTFTDEDRVLSFMDSVTIEDAIGGNPRAFR